MATEKNEKISNTSSTTTAAMDQLTRLLREEPRPSEYDIAILRSTKEGDPFVKIEHHLGLHAGDLPWLARDFRQAYREIRPIKGDSEHVLKVTSCLLLVCPDHATAWADRKRALLSISSSSNRKEQEHCYIQIWKQELEFLNLLMTKHTKA